LPTGIESPDPPLL